jgi:hypothetical protein
MAAGPSNDIELYVQQLTNPQHRENALLELSKKRETFSDLAPFLWHSFGTVAALLQEIVSIYPMLSPPTLNAHASNRVCNALALLQCVASHQETRGLFLQGGQNQHPVAATLCDSAIRRRITLLQHTFRCSCTHSCKRPARRGPSST